MTKQDHWHPGHRPIVPAQTELPPPPPGVRHVRVVRTWIVIADDPLRLRVDRYFHWPMIVLALLILPLLAIEFFNRPEPGTWLWWLSAIALAVIWIAFVVEFIIKIAIAECRIEYIRRNWLDLVIIALPALRPLRLASVAKTSRVFTLRGVGMKFVRYTVTLLIGLEATERLLERLGLRLRAGRRDPHLMTRHQLIDEVKKLRALTDGWQRWHDSYKESQFRHHLDELPPTPPEIEASPHDPSTIPNTCESPSHN